MQEQSRILENLEREPNFILRLTRLAERMLVGKPTEPSKADYEAFVQMMMEGDPLADDLAAWALEYGVGKGLGLLDRALKQGVDSIPEAPAQMRALFAHIEQPPDWFDLEMVQAGQRAVQRSGIWGPTILGDVALVGGYVILGSMNKSLVATGGLQEGSSLKRLVETYQWFLDLSADGGLDRFGRGYESSVKVRVLHGLIRQTLAARPNWKTKEWGIPVSQGHMAATLQAFAAAFITLARGVGIHYSKDDRRNIMHMWAYVGWLMGLREDYCYRSESDGLGVIYLSARTSPPLDQDAIDLANAYFESEYDFGFLGQYRLGFLSSTCTKLSTRARLGLIRLVLGKRDYQSLKLPEVGLWVTLPLGIAAATHVVELLGRLLPGYKRLSTRSGRWLQEGMRLLTKEEFRREAATFVPYANRQADA